MDDARILEQVAYRPPVEDMPPALPAMLGRIVEHVTSLTQRGQVRRRVVARIMVEMRAGEHDKGRPHARERDALAHPDPPTATAPPAPRLRVPPSPVTQMRDIRAVRPPAPLAARSGAAETDCIGQLRPVDRIQPAVLGTDRHPDPMNHAQIGAKWKMSSIHRKRIGGGTDRCSASPRASSNSPCGWWRFILHEHRRPEPGCGPIRHIDWRALFRKVLLNSIGNWLRDGDDRYGLASALPAFDSG